MNDVQPVQFVVPGDPVGKGRPRVSTIGGHARMFTPKKTASYEGLIAVVGDRAMAGRPPIECPVMVEMRIVLPVPASKTKKFKAQALAGEIFPAKKPDMDNVVKAIFDGLNGIVWRDDVQVVDAIVRKRYGETPGVHVKITPRPQEAA
ncbi:endodeoxyribonuclease RusA [Pseudomonas putida]|uniref:RusA family crossover junction endodeoxyribonuclease n=1 Tax=Pseudomonas putida TaxID=303 RepID=UPI0007B6BBA1|nr:RusA family crossover junction endodeoxyribonuclease [Pseudomonas putida]ANC03982.1 endodeoxyribonuclease RusA [Pseudomonas putida]